MQLRNECNRIMQTQGCDEEVGKAKITSGYNLPSRYVIHTVGPALPYGAKPSKEDEKKLAGCYESCLDIATHNKLDSIAFCCISTGVFNYPKKQAAELALKTVENYLNENETTLNHIIFNVFGDEDYLIYKKLIFGD